MVYWGSSKVLFKTISQNFIKSPLKLFLISQILVHSLWHVCGTLVGKLADAEKLLFNAGPAKPRYAMS